MNIENIEQDQGKPGLDILNAGKGHVEVRFDNNDPLEIERAKRIITDMLKRGYVLFIEGKGKELTRVKSFDQVKGVYLIADLGEQAEAIEPAPAIKRGRGRPKKEVDMTKVRVTAVGRSAGG